MSSLRFYGSINFTKLYAELEAKHSAFLRVGENKDIVANVTGWLTTEPDQYGNSLSVHLSPKENTTDKSVYVLNMKAAAFLSGDKWEPIKEGEVPVIDLSKFLSSE